MNYNVEVTYTPKGPSLQGYRGIFVTTRLMWRELLSARELIWRLFLRDFKAKYRQSALGIIWAVLMPLITVGIFVGMSRSGLLTVHNVSVPYSLYALIGLTIWSLFAVGLTASTQSLVNAGSMVVKINFPKVALVLAASGQGLVELVIRFILIAVVFIYFGVVPNWTGMFIGLISLLPLYLITIGIGFVMSLVAGVVRDVINVLNVALMGFMLLTPILYPISGTSLLARINVWNPFNYLVNVPRDFILEGHSKFIDEFLLITVFSIAICYLGWKLFYLAQTKIAERI